MGAPKNSSAPGQGGQDGGSFFDQWLGAVNKNVGAMMGQTPPPPDYTGAAEKTAQGNRVNQTNAFGAGVRFNPDGSQSQSFGGGMQGSADALMRQMQDAYSKPFDNGSAARDQAVNAAYSQATSRLDPRFSQEQGQLSSQLANQGLDPSSQAYKTAMDNFGREKTDAYSSAMNNAIGMGNQAQALTFNQNMASRMAPLQALQGMQGFLSMPGYNPGANYLQAAALQGQYGLDQAAAAQQAQADIMSGVGGMVGGGLNMAKGGLSDARVKQNIERLPLEAMPGVPLALFEYRAMPGQRHLGVIAQDLEKVAPEHVAEDARGIKHVSPAFAPFAFGKKR